ncbi:MAG: NAD(P)H-dependent oxidoreductase subunit E [Phycisphaerales bacterium]|nr:NAD(P)H-dependent oxidoreductase subunit E [Phycisphaerales bacterium]
MSWKTKLSRSMVVTRPTTPFCTPAMIAQWEQKLLPRYATRHGALMPILHDVQHAYRHIPYAAMLEIAAFLRIPPSEVLDTVSFYEEYTTQPQGACVIGICHTFACEICGHQAILNHVRKRLGIEPHETTPDGAFTLLTMECLGSCDTAPVALFNDVLHEGLTIEKLDRLIDEVLALAPRKSPHAGSST